MRLREGTTAYPLSWPAGWERTKAHERRRAPFGRGARTMPCTIFSASQRVLRELDRIIGVSHVVISSNLMVRNDGIPYSKQPRTDDPGVAVYFNLHGEERVLACDRWDRHEHNLHAIYLHIEAMRGQERWGVGSIEQAFRGFVGLPEHAGHEAHWRVVLFGDVHPATEITPEDVNRRFKELMRERHTDVGGSQSDAADLSRARVDALRELGG